VIGVLAMGRCRSLLGLAIFAAVTAWATPSYAQSWPARTVRFILTLGPGSGTDISSRLLADRLTRTWGQPVVVENRPGGDGIVAISAILNANDDHVLLASPSSSFIAHPYLHGNLPYKPGDLAPIARVSNVILVIAAPASLAVKSFADVVSMARKQPGKLNWAGGTGAIDFLFAGFLKSNGLTMTKVPYRNLVEAANDLAEGRLQVYDASLAVMRPQLQVGKIKLLAVTNSARFPTELNVPTIDDVGYPELTFDGLVGFFGPPRMPLPLRERIAENVREVMTADPVIAERLNATGQLASPGGPVEFAAAIDEQRARLAAVVRELGVKATQ
jgi:tripartite-type tricarboxylate transporter receptor subunit TctC